MPHVCTLQLRTSNFVCTFVELIGTKALKTLTKLVVGVLWAYSGTSENFQDTHGALRGHLCGSSGFLYIQVNVPPSDRWHGRKLAKQTYRKSVPNSAIFLKNFLLNGHLNPNPISTPMELENKSTVYKAEAHDKLTRPS